jgi:hypothetical protein
MLAASGSRETPFKNNVTSRLININIEETHVLKTLLTTRFSKALGVGLIAGIAGIFASPPAQAEDKIQPPPYAMSGLNAVSLGIVWDEAAVRKALPPGIVPVKEMTGGINIYSVERGYVIGPYSAAYFYVDIEGFDSPEGIKGRWMLAGAYGPQAKTSAALKEYYGLPVRQGSSRFETTAEGKRAIGTVDGKDFVAVEIKSQPGACDSIAISLNYVAQAADTKQIGFSKIPVVGDSCKAEPVSAKVTAPAGDAFSAFPIAKVVSASEVKNASFAFTTLQAAPK